VIPAVAPDLVSRVDVPPVLTGDGVRLRPWELADADAVLRLADDDVSRRWSPSLSRVFTLDEARAWIENRQQRGSNWAVVDPTTDELLGRVGLHHFDEDGMIAEIGYGVMPSHRRTGVATRAVAAAVAYGFGSLGLVRISLEHAVGNEGSCAVARVSGFAPEGVLRSALHRGDGLFDDVHLHARLATDPVPVRDQRRSGT
jgi:RimJ/RimL family protein N-acetyltransferase